MDADEQQQHRGRCHGKTSSARIPAHGQSRPSKRCVRGEGQHNMAHPILKLWRVRRLFSHPARHDYLVCQSAQAQRAPKHCERSYSFPRSRLDAGQQQHRAEMNDHWRRERGASLCSPWSTQSVCNQGHDDKLQPDQSARGRADEHVEILPTRERCHCLCPCNPNRLAQAVLYDAGQ